jgi:hypothetical protein
MRGTGASRARAAPVKWSRYADVAAAKAAKAYPSYADVMKEVNETTAGAVTHNHLCSKGYCADEFGTNGGAHDTVYYAYNVQPEGHAAYYSYCEPFYVNATAADTSLRACYTSQGKAWIDQADGKNGWTTVRKLRESF